MGRQALLLLLVALVSAVSAAPLRLQDVIPNVDFQPDPIKVYVSQELKPENIITNKLVTNSHSIPARPHEIHVPHQLSSEEIESNVVPEIINIHKIQYQKVKPFPQLQVSDPKDNDKISDQSSDAKVEAENESIPEKSSPETEPKPETMLDSSVNSNNPKNQLSETDNLKPQMVADDKNDNTNQEDRVESDVRTGAPSDAATVSENQEKPLGDATEQVPEPEPTSSTDVDKINQDSSVQMELNPDKVQIDDFPEIELSPEMISEAVDAAKIDAEESEAFKPDHEASSDSVNADLTSESPQEQGQT